MPFSPGQKRPVSSLSPTLFAVDFSQKTKSTKKSLPSPSVPQPPMDFAVPTTTTMDFGITTIPSATPEGDLNLSTFMLEVRNRLSRLETAQVEISHLRAALADSQSALAESESARKALEAQVALLSTPTTTKIVPTTTPTTAAATPATASVSAANTASKKRKKKPVPPPLPSLSKASAIVGRLFGPQTDIPSGYQFVYMKISVRRPLKELRRLIQTVGLSNSRVLDIQYPVSNVVSFLVHNDYVLTFTSAMHTNGRGCSPLVDFDPCDQINLKDPKFDSLSPSLRAQKAIEIENLRCLRSVSFVRRSVRLSVARSFLFHERINQAQFDAILAEELSARASSAPPPASPSSDQERSVKRQRLCYLGYLLHHDANTASLLAYTNSPVLSPAPTDSPMLDIPGI